MIDSQDVPPKKGRRPVSGMLRLLLVIVLVWIATGCLAERGLERTAAPARTVLKSSAAADDAPAKTAESEESAASGSATAAGEAKPDEKPDEKSQEAAPEGETAEAQTQEKPEEQPQDTPEEKPERPGKIVLDTEYDDRRVGDEQTDAVRAELGIVGDEALNRYVQSVAIRLLRHAPPRPFEYEFKIVDQTVPNAFALPGGKIYVSRGLLALVGS